MKQVTVKDIYAALDWIENNGHHKGKWEEEYKFFVLEGHKTRLRIPHGIKLQMHGLIEPAPGKFDTRMFRATINGKRKLRVHKRKVLELLG